MSISSTEASLRAVRQDLDMGAGGSIKDRAVRNKINNTGGSIKLADFKGNVLGQQLSIKSSSWTGSWSSQLRNVTSAHSFNMVDYRPCPIYVSGSEIRLPWANQGYGDTGCEIRICGRVNESGTYRLTGSFNAELSGGSYDRSAMHIYLIQNVNGHLSGSQNVVISDEFFESTGKVGNQGYSKNCTLKGSYPYVTLIVRNIQLDYQDFAERTHRIWNFKLVKV